MIEYGEGAIGSEEGNTRAMVLDCCDEVRGENWARMSANVAGGVLGVEDDGWW